MPAPVLNALRTSSSVFLRTAMQQPVQWMPWGEDALARAAAEDKPILLTSGAVWCRWSHVMDRESYDDPAVAALINEHFVAIKVDRDERPDLDTRLQAAVSAISGQGGWPLTVFLTPGGRPYFGGTYFPAEERYGQPGFERVLRMMAASFYERRDEVEESAGSVLAAIEYGECYASAPGDLRHAESRSQLLHALTEGVLQQFDAQHGGFGEQPKFPHTTAIDLLLKVAGQQGPLSERAAHAALATLHAMARGGIRDQLAGGFHRYAADRRWTLPHFEMMLFDNAALLSTFLRASEQFNDVECISTATALLRWIDETLANREHGGFYASLGAEMVQHATAGYYTWTYQEAAAVLQLDELRLAEQYFQLGRMGNLPHDPTRNVLLRNGTLEQAAQAAGITTEDAPALLQSVVDKLRTVRNGRPALYLDRSVYTGWNCMAISAYVRAARVLRQPSALAFARLSLDRVLATVYREGRVGHVVAYPDLEQIANDTPAVLDNHVLLAHACLDMSEATGDPAYADAARQVAAVLLNSFSDAQAGGFFDTPIFAADALGVLTARRKPLQDAFTPAGNSAAAGLLLRLHAYTAEDTYLQASLATLECFAGVVQHLGLYAASFGLALQQLSHALEATQQPQRV